MILVESHEAMTDRELILALVETGLYDLAAAEAVVAIERGQIAPPADP